MSNSVYQINKGINKAIEFRGLKAQYIWYLAGGILLLMTLFAVLYIAGINTFICRTSPDLRYSSFYDGISYEQ